MVRKDLWEKRIARMSHLLNPNLKNLRKKILRKQKELFHITKKILPKIYGMGSLRGFDKPFQHLYKGIKKVVYRQVKKSDMRVVVHKSTALAAQNFLVSMAGYGYDTCTMEGFDSLKIKKIVGLPSSAEISMVIGCGIRTKKGIYGPRFGCHLMKFILKSKQSPSRNLNKVNLLSCTHLI